MSSRTKTIAVVLGLIVIIGLVYVTFFNNNGGANGVTSTGTTPSPDEQTFLDLSQKLGSISFDTSVFSDPRFTSLVDIHTQVIPEQQGKKDPFAPLNGGSTQ